MRRRSHGHEGDAVGFWHRAKVMLGLADDFDEEYDEYGEHEYEDEAFASSEPQVRQPYDSSYGSEPTSIRRLSREPDVGRAREAAARPGGGYAEAPSAMPEPQVKMHIVEPHSFSEAQSIADKYKLGVPVIMNLTSSDPDLAKRLIDFTSGLTYGADGGLQKVADRVFMLTPANISVSAEDRRRLRDKGLFSLDV
jgi:cell division inhibitor SepF